MNNLIWAYRTLKKRSIYTFLGIIGFAVGFAVFMSILLYVDHEKSMDQVYANHENIYRLIDDNGDKPNAQIDYNLNAIITDNYPGVIQACPVRQKSKWPFLFRSDMGYLKTSTFISTTNDFFSLFSIKVIKSLSQLPLADKNSIVLPKSTANKLFPNSEPLGQVVKFMDEEKLIVSAIIEDLPSESSFKADVIISSETPKYRLGRKRVNGKFINPVNHYVVLKENVNPKEFVQKLNQSLAGYSVEVKKVSLQPIKDIYYSENIAGNTNKNGSKVLLYLFEAVGVLILMLSLINYIHFILATQSLSQKSAGIKLLHGAGVKGIIKYYLTESSLSLLIALVVSLIFLWIGLPIVNNILHSSLIISSLFNGRILAILIGIIAFIVLAVALLSSSTSQNRGLVSLVKSKSIKKRTSANSILSVFQLAVSIVLIIGAIGIKMQLNLMQTRSLGFDSEHVLRLDLPSTFSSYNAMKEAVNQLSFVENSSWSNGSPGSISFEVSLKDNDKTINLNGFSGDENFLSTMDISCIEGRDLLPSDKGKACLVNQATLKATNCTSFEEFVLKHNSILWDIKIVGVVNDFNFTSMHGEIEPIFFLYSSRDYSFLNIKLSQGSVFDQMAQIKNIWQQFVPDYPFDATFYNAYFDSLYKKEEAQGKALTFFSIITILITCLGLLGQIIHQSASKTKEIGIRKVNGAKTVEILALLNKDFVKSVALAFVCAGPIGYYALTKWLENFAYKAELSGWIFALAGFVALLTALLTVSFQSWKAATRNPVEALRYE